MYYAMRASAPSLHRESTDSLIHTETIVVYSNTVQETAVFKTYSLIQWKLSIRTSLNRRHIQEQEVSSVTEETSCLWKTEKRRSDWRGS